MIWNSNFSSKGVLWPTYSLDPQNVNVVDNPWLTLKCIFKNEDEENDWSELCWLAFPFVGLGTYFPIYMTCKVFLSVLGTNCLWEFYRIVELLSSIPTGPRRSLDNNLALSHCLETLSCIVASIKEFRWRKLHSSLCLLFRSWANSFHQSKMFNLMIL